jgi:transposase-like protein
MLIHLHKQATTPKVRAAIQESDEIGTVLAERFGVTSQTIYKWRKRDSVEDRSHTQHRSQIESLLWQKQALGFVLQWQITTMARLAKNFW